MLSPAEYMSMTLIAPPLALSAVKLLGCRCSVSSQRRYPGTDEFGVPFQRGRQHCCCCKPRGRNRLLLNGVSVCLHSVRAGAEPDAVAAAYRDTTTDG